MAKGGRAEGKKVERVKKPQGGKGEKGGGVVRCERRKGWRRD